MPVAQPPVIASDNVRQLFSEIAKSITCSLEITKIINTVMQQVDRFFQPRYSSLFRLDPETHELYFMVAKGINLDDVKTVRLKLGEGVVGYVAQTRKSLIIEDAQNDARFSFKVDKLSQVKTKSLIAVPIVFQNRTLGVIELINTLEERGFSQSELALLETIADFAAIAMTNAMAYERILWYSQHDPLTGLFNRSHLDQLTTEYRNLDKAALKETDHSYAIAILIDVDKFKEVNDSRGHQIGDQILIKMAQILNAVCRKNDFAYRIGGDEFLITILDLDKNEVSAIMTRLQKSLKLSSKQIAPAQGFSFGMASGLKNDLRRLIKKADDQMYIYKGIRRKNRVSSETS